jgi:hypothetical protein
MRSCRVSFRRYKGRQVSILLDFGTRRAGRLELQVGVYTAASLLRSDVTSFSVGISLLKIHLGYLQSTQVLSALDYTKLMCAPSQGRKEKKGSRCFALWVSTSFVEVLEQGYVVTVFGI